MIASRIVPVPAARGAAADEPRISSRWTFVFPVVVLLGRALGRYKKYADAPEPGAAPSAR